MLKHLKSEELDWALSISEKLNDYGLETDWDTIGKKTKVEWKRIVEEAVEKKNKKKAYCSLHHRRPSRN